MLGRKVRNLVGSHQPGPEGPGAGEVLPWRELDVVPLPVAHRGVVEAGIAGDMTQRLPGRNGPASLADDYRQLPFVVQLLGHGRPNDRRARPHQGVREAGEHRRMIGLGPPRLLPVGLVVEADAEDLAGIGDHGKQVDLPQVKHASRGEARQTGRGDGGLQVVQPGQLDDAIPLDPAESGLPIGGHEARVLHGPGSHSRLKRKVRSARPSVSTSLSVSPH